ncbi:MAG: hypothetical protein JNK38_14315 [Acidobacteria bacterium]|nr:hypothetical protein [Acidobacteriota bacterium]
MKLKGHFAFRHQLIFALATAVAISATAHSQTRPLFSLREAPQVRMPGVFIPPYIWGIDGNSPAERDANGNLILFNSLSFPWRSTGPDLFNLTPSQPITIRDRDEIEGGLWMEGLYRDADGKLFGWMHNEFQTGCENMAIGAPRIRQMISDDEGKTWQDLGVIITAPDGFFNCETENIYFTGGTGDFSVLFDPATQYFYFYFTTYSPDFSQQGIGIARLRYEDRLQPVGKVKNWHEGEWNESAIGGKLSPIFPPAISWHKANLDAFWGPAIHYNAYLDQYVMLLNHALGAAWSTEGFYISFNPDIENPSGWSAPQRLPVEPDSPLQAYPQIFGIEEDGTDKLARQVGRLFLQGASKHEIVFWQPVPKPQRQAGSSGDRLPPPLRTNDSKGRTRQSFPDQ